MSESCHPTPAEISLVLSHLADRVAADSGPGIDPIVLASLRRAVVELELWIPGVDPAPDAQAARFLASSSAAALHHARERVALARALRGLSYAPHDPELHYLAGCACFELGAAGEAIALIRHALWIHPGFARARDELEALSAFSNGPPATLPAAAAREPEADPQLQFELFEAIPEEQGEEQRSDWIDGEEDPGPGDFFEDDGSEDWSGGDVEGGDRAA